MLKGGLSPLNHKERWESNGRAFKKEKYIQTEYGQDRAILFYHAVLPWFHGVCTDSYRLGDGDILSDIRCIYRQGCFCRL